MAPERASRETAVAGPRIDDLELCVQNEDDDDFRFCPPFLSRDEIWVLEYM